MVATERVLRKLYLRGFEIAVRKAHPRCVMTSYNAIGGDYTSTRRDLLEEILRREWGFDGVVLKDWEGDGIYAVESLQAGNDVLMHGFDGQRRYQLDQLAAGRLQRRTLEACAANLLRVILAPSAFERFR